MRRLKIGFQNFPKWRHGKYTNEKQRNKVIEYTRMWWWITAKNQNVLRRKNFWFRCKYSQRFSDSMYWFFVSLNKNFGNFVHRFFFKIYFCYTLFCRQGNKKIGTQREYWHLVCEQTVFTNAIKWTAWTNEWMKWINECVYGNKADDIYIYSRV